MVGELMRALILAVLWLFFVAVFSLIGAIPVYYLWNWLMPDLFHLPVVTFWQSWGLLGLSSILFKSSMTSKG